MSNKPNILLIMADQLAAPALPFYGNRIVKTPYLNSLAASGTVFENAYCNFPICAPSRASMLSGQLASRIGAWDNAADFPATTPTIPYYLRNLQYRTILSGKMHFVGPDQLHGYEERLTTDICPSDFTFAPDWRQTGILSTAAGTNMRGMVEAGVCEASMQLDFDEEVHFHARRRLVELGRSRGEEPFFLTVSYTQPHHPYLSRQEYWDLYEHDEIDMPKVPFIPVEQRDPHGQRLYYLANMDEYDLTEERVRNARHAYYGMISYIDDKVGDLMRVLDATGLSDNTVVIFLSDHGEMLGERGMWYKMTFFEPAVRIPLLIRMPGQTQPRRVSTNVSLVDLLPTLVDVAGGGQSVEYTDPVDGRSLRPLLESDSADDRENVVYAEFTAEGSVEPCFMVIKERMKYVWSKSDGGRLHDLEADPNELRDLTNDPAYATKRAELEKLIRDRWDVEAIYRACFASQARRRVLQAAIDAQSSRVSWDYQPKDDASKKYLRSGPAPNLKMARSRVPFRELVPPDHPRKKTA